MAARFLEISLASANVAESIHFYLKLGFRELPTGDIWPHHYAVVTDGQLCIGLHGREQPGPAVTMIMHGVADTVQRIDADTVVSGGRLDDDAFNEVLLTDPDGHLLALVEARTFSPGVETGGASSLGRCLEYTLPARDALEGARFWAPYAPKSLAVMETPSMHFRFDAGGLPIGISERSRQRQAFLSFACDDLATAGLAADAAGSRLEPAGKAAPGAVGWLRSPEGLGFALYEADFLDH
jgi:catechol 2,3-dioxygenase-like lactoylglutathione lyase family enzyme